MLAFLVAIIVLGLTQVISVLLAFRYGMSNNQTLPPSKAAQKTSSIGAIVAVVIAASPWLPEWLLAWMPAFDAVLFLSLLGLFLAVLFAALMALLQQLEKL
jgi:hypothetical protein